MLLRLLLVVVASAVWAMETETEAETETERDYNYFPAWLIESTKEPHDFDTSIISSRKPRITGKVKGGTICLNTDECGRGKCCLRRSKSPRRRCRRLQRAGERCTEEQMMGGYYYGFCPCNRRSVCKYVNGTQMCVKKKEQRPPKPVPLPTVPPETNVTQQEMQESQESEEVQKPKIPSRKPAFNLSGNHFPEIPDFLINTLRPTLPPVHVPGTPSPVPTQAVGQEPSMPTAPVQVGGQEIPGGTPIPPLSNGLTIIPVQEEEEGLPGTGGVPGLPPPPVAGPQVPSVVEEQQGLPGEGDVPQLPPPPPLDDVEKNGQPLQRTSRSAPPPDALLEEQSQVAMPPIASAVGGPPFNFDAVDGNQQRIL